ncbi:MAG: glycosyltransferase family 4 protein [Flavobacteriales bacterium]|nr:glycosyltransferase family 4 protein [Flavobacteriales bacterium]
MKAVFLYSELAGYTLACFKKFCEQGNQLLVYRWPINQEAPFVFDPIENCEIIDRTDKTPQLIKQSIDDFGAEVIVTSGWMDKGYLEVVKQYKGKIPTAVAIDNHWDGSIKQKIAALISPFYLKRIFSHAWVPGLPQRKFAEKLGIGTIEEGFYSADVELFNSIGDRSREAKKENYPKRILYIGRYTQHKGIFELWKAFKELSNDFPDWELWCVGTGDAYDQRDEHPKIKHFGFKQPNELPEIIDQVGAFIQPSHFEPWGVVAHEMVAASMPILCSKNVGSSTAFLDDKENGYLFNSNQHTEIVDALQRLMSKTSSELFEMGQKSYESAKKISPKKWSKTLQSMKI